MVYNMDERYDYSPSVLMNLKGINTIVTGAAGQLGSGIVCGLLDCGSNVIAADVSIEDLEEAAIRWGWSSERVLLTTCDIRIRKDVSATIIKGAKAFDYVDGIVNNAGVSVFEPYLERSEESLDWVTDVNLKGTFICIQEFIKHRIERGGGGVMVNIASHYGLVSPDPRIYTDCERKNSEIYGATKAGVIQITRYFAVHAAKHSIRVNAVSPGGVRNPDNPQGADFQKNYAFRCPMGRMAETHEVVGAVLFLLGPAATYINGTNIVVDGGMTCW